MKLAVCLLLLAHAAGRFVRTKENAADETQTNSKSINTAFNARRLRSVDGRTLNFGTHAAPSPTASPQDEGTLRFEAGGEVVGAPFLADQLRVAQIVDGTFEVSGPDIECDDVLEDPAYLAFVVEWSGAAEDAVTLTCVSVDLRRRLQDAEVLVVKLSYAIRAASAGDAAEIVQALGETEPEAALSQVQLIYPAPEGVEVGEYSEQVAGRYTTRYEFLKPLNIESFSFAAGAGGLVEVTPCCQYYGGRGENSKNPWYDLPFDTTAQTVAPGEEALVALPGGQTCLFSVDITLPAGASPATEMAVKLPPKDTPLLMAPDSKSDRIVLFDPSDGSVVDKCFIDGFADDIGSPRLGNAIGFKTPNDAIQVGNEIWVADQMADTIYQFDLHGLLLSRINGSTTGLGDAFDNLRGLAYADPYVYQAINGIPGGVLVFNTAGSYLGGFIVPPAPPGENAPSVQDVLAYEGKLFISNSQRNEDSLMTLTQNGKDSEFIEHIATSDGVTDFDFPQQITVRGSDGTLLVGVFSVPRGIYNFGTDGTTLNIYRAGSPVRAAYELGSGNIMWSSGDGMIVLNLTTGGEVGEYVYKEASVETPGAELPFRPSMRYIEPLLIPSS